MGYIYKLVDETELRLAKKGRLSLSRPIFSFKGSEGYFINFAKDIYDRYQKEGLAIVPKEKDLKEIRKWIEAYQSVFQDIREEDLRSDSMIIFCRIMSTYCGYFTKSNLDDPTVLDDYRKRSHLKDKIAYIRIDETRALKPEWKCESGSFVFQNDLNYSLSEIGHYHGHLFPKDVEYIAQYKDTVALLRAFRDDPDHSTKAWFTILSQDFSWQNEKRLVFALNSLEANAISSACDRAYQSPKGITCCEDVIFREIVDAIHYAKNGPKYIYLKMDPGLIMISNFSQ